MKTGEKKKVRFCHSVKSNCTQTKVGEHVANRKIRTTLFCCFEYTKHTHNTEFFAAFFRLFSSIFFSRATTTTTTRQMNSLNECWAHWITTTTATIIFWLDARLQANKNARAPTRTREKARASRTQTKWKRVCVCASSEAFVSLWIRLRGTTTHSHSALSIVHACCLHTHTGDGRGAHAHSVAHFPWRRHSGICTHSTAIRCALYSDTISCVHCYYSIRTSAVFFVGGCSCRVAEYTTEIVLAHASLEYARTQSNW